MMFVTDDGLDRRTRYFVMVGEDSEIQKFNSFEELFRVLTNNGDEESHSSEIEALEEVLKYESSNSDKKRYHLVIDDRRFGFGMQVIRLF